MYQYQPTLPFGVSKIKYIYVKCFIGYTIFAYEIGCDAFFFCNKLRRKDESTDTRSVLKASPLISLSSSSKVINARI